MSELEMEKRFGIHILRVDVLACEDARHTVFQAVGGVAARLGMVYDILRDIRAVDATWGGGGRGYVYEKKINQRRQNDGVGRCVGVNG